VLTADFAERYRVQWNAFVKKMGERISQIGSRKVIEDLRKFAIPMFHCAALDEGIGKQWRAGKGWLTD
jgi:hypothetical protein